MFSGKPFRQYNATRTLFAHRFSDNYANYILFTRIIEREREKERDWVTGVALKFNYPGSTRVCRIGGGVPFCKTVPRLLAPGVRRELFVCRQTLMKRFHNTIRNGHRLFSSAHNKKKKNKLNNNYCIDYRTRRNSCFFFSSVVVVFERNSLCRLSGRIDRYFAG